MAHMHGVRDDDPVFSIDTDSRVIMYPDENTPMLIQHDHNSERFTFEVQHEIDGHPVESCNRIRVHFINVSAENQNEFSASMYKVDDAATYEEAPDMVRFTWLIDQSATQYVGSLSFLVELSCVNESGVIEYSWHSGIFEGITVSNGMDNSDAVIGDRYDVIDAWAAQLKLDITTSVGKEVTKLTENAIDQINAMKDSLAVDVISTRGILTQNTGTDQYKIMSQDAVTKEINATNGRIDHLTSDKGLGMYGAYLEEFTFTKDNSNLKGVDTVKGTIEINGPIVTIKITEADVNTYSVYDDSWVDVGTIPMHGSTIPITANQAGLFIMPSPDDEIGDIFIGDIYSEFKIEEFQSKDDDTGKWMYLYAYLRIYSDGSIRLIGPDLDDFTSPSFNPQYSLDLTEDKPIVLSYISDNDRIGYLSPELLQLRVDKDGNTHETMRDAIVSQFQAIDREIESAADSVYASLNLDELESRITNLETSSNLDKLESRVSKNDNRITNLEKALIKDELFITDSSSVYTKKVPEDVLPYAEISKIGGMTYRNYYGEGNLIPYPYIEAGGLEFVDTNGKISLTNDLYNDIDFVISSGGEAVYPAGTYIYEIEFIQTANNQSTPSLTFTNYGSVAPTITKITDYKYQVAAQESFQVSQFKVTIGNAGGSGNGYETVIFRPMFYDAATPITWRDRGIPELYSARATAIESIGVNLFDIDKFLSLKGNSTYYSKNENGELVVIGYDTRANGDIETIMTLPAGAYYVQFDRETVGLAPYEVFVTGTNTGLIDGSSPYYFTLTEEQPISMKFVQQTTANFGHVQVHRGTSEQTYYPFSDGPLSTFTIPEAVRDIPGYGDGVSAEYNNHIEYTENGVKFVEWMHKIVFDGTENWQTDYHHRDGSVIGCHIDDMLNSIPMPKMTTYERRGTIYYRTYGVAVPIGFCDSDEYSPNNEVRVYDGGIDICIRNQANNVMDADELKVYLAEQYANGLPVTVMYAIAEPKVSDITDRMPPDNFLRVESGGTIRVISESSHDIPTEITYQQKEEAK